MSGQSQIGQDLGEGFEHELPLRKPGVGNGQVLGFHDLVTNGEDVATHTLFETSRDGDQGFTDVALADERQVLNDTNGSFKVPLPGTPHFPLNGDRLAVQFLRRSVMKQFYDRVVKIIRFTLTINR